MNRAAFFASVRASLFGGSLSASQVSGIEAILDEWDRCGLSDLRWLAYMLGTVFHECARKMEPIAEYGHGKGHPYGKPGKDHGQIAYGRGFVQLTWDYNYERADKELGLGGALTSNYELALEPKTAAAILFGGMLGGWFTTKKLADYFHGGEADWINARRIINGTDKAQTIAGYAKAFYAALLASAEAHPATPASPVETPKPVPPSPLPSTYPPAPLGFWEAVAAIVKAILGGFGRKP